MFDLRRAHGIPCLDFYGGTQVRSNALQTVQQGQVDVSSGLRAVGAGLAQVGEAVDKVAQRQIETEANRIDTEVTAGWLQWDAENRPKYQGQNADAYKTDAEKWWSDRKGQYSEADAAARGRIGQALARKQNQALGAVYGHVNAEKERYADQLPPEQFMYSMLTRSQRISHENLRLRDKGWLEGYERWFAQRAGLARDPAAPAVPPMFSSRSQSAACASFCRWRCTV